MNAWELAGQGALVVLAYVTAVWLLSLALRDASIVDIFWGMGFVVLAWFYFVQTGDPTPRKWLLAALVTAWGLRLSLHILVRNWGHGEDYRYQRWRKAAGAKFWWTSYFRVYLLQGTLLWIISAPLLAAQRPGGPDALGPLDYAGIAVWAFGFFFEAVGDWQLVRFKRDPANKGQLLTTGLWRYTRHPNYFGDATLWWGHWLIAAAVPSGWMTIFSPLAMTFLLVKVSGVALLERNLKKSKPGFEDYMARTSAFVPMRPRRN